MLLFSYEKSKAQRQSTLLKISRRLCQWQKGPLNPGTLALDVPPDNPISKGQACVWVKNCGGK